MLSTKAAAFAEKMQVYAVAPKQCLNCSTALTYTQAVTNRQKFCCSSCAATYNNKGRKRSVISRLKTAVSVRNALGKGDAQANALVPLITRKNPIEAECEQCKGLYKKTKPLQRFCSKKCFFDRIRTTPEATAERSVKNVTNWRHKIKQKAVEYKGGCCQLCGYDRCISALEFHHINPAEKDFSLGTRGITRPWKVLKSELEKCILVCANCHRELHAGLLDLPEEYV